MNPSKTSKTSQFASVLIYTLIMFQYQTLEFQQQQTISRYFQSQISDPGLLKFYLIRDLTGFISLIFFTCIIFTYPKAVKYLNFATITPAVIMYALDNQNYTNTKILFLIFTNSSVQSLDMVIGINVLFQFNDPRNFTKCYVFGKLLSLTSVLLSNLIQNTYDSLVDIFNFSLQITQQLVVCISISVFYSSYTVHNKEFLQLNFPIFRGLGGKNARKSVILTVYVCFFQMITIGSNYEILYNLVFQFNSSQYLTRNYDIGFSIASIVMFQVFKRLKQRVHCKVIIGLLCVKLFWSIGKYSLVQRVFLRSIINGASSASILVYYEKENGLYVRDFIIFIEIFYFLVSIVQSYFMQAVINVFQQYDYFSLEAKQILQNYILTFIFVVFMEYINILQEKYTQRIYK